jgi:hypothetical protein
VSEDKQYPPWQEAIRAAQVRRDEKRREQEIAKEKRRELEELQTAANLKQALGWLGIEADPTRNAWQEGDYRFRLAVGAETIPDWRHSFSVGKRHDCGEALHAWFTLFIGFISPDTLEYEWHNLNAELTVVGVPVLDSWDEERAQLADKLDRLLENFKEQIPDYLAWREQHYTPVSELEAVVVPKPALSAEERLLDAMLTVIDERVEATVEVRLGQAE